MRHPINYYICFCRSALLLSACCYCVISANKVVAVLVTYLNGVLTKDSILWSVAIVNVREGLRVLVTIMIQISSYASKSGVKITLLTTFAYCMGLVLLFLSSVSIIPRTNSGLYIIAAVLLAVGTAGVLPRFKTYLGDQLRAGHEQASSVYERRVRCRKNVWLILTQLVSICTIPLILSKYTWPSRFAHSAVMMGATHILFWFGIPLHHQKKPTEKSCNCILRVIAAALLKRHLSYPHSPDEYLKNDDALSSDAETCAGVESKHPQSLSPEDGTLPPADDRSVFKREGSQLHLLPQIRFLRCLDRAAIIEPSPSPSPEEQQKAGRLCTVSQVKEVKLLLTMIPMWIAYIIFGLAQSTANSFFSLQEESLKAHKFLFTHVSIFWLLLLKEVLRVAISSSWKFLVSKRIPKSQQNQALLVRICLGMMMSVLYLAVAWRFEVHRLRIVHQCGLAMTNLKLLPQFCLWGLSEGLATNGLGEFFNYQVSKSLEDSDFEIFNTIPFGIGAFLNGVCSYLCRQWFANTLNLSRLDKYLHMITIFAFINSGLFFLVVIFYTRMKTAKSLSSIP